MSDEKSMGTVRWFGASWGAPVNEAGTRVAAPVGEQCPPCDRPIQPDDRGVGVPHVGLTSYEGCGVYRWWHLDCWLREIGAEVTREVLNQPNS